MNYSNYKILMVDDEIRMRKLVKDFLYKEGFTVLEAEDGASALEIFCNNSDISLIILDVMMPRMDGFEFLDEVRRLSRVPIIMLTAKDSENDELKGFRMGVDEYLSKPFSPKILVARVEAILRRVNQKDEGGVINLGNISINKLAHTVKIDDEVIDLSMKEFQLLLYLVNNENIALSRDNILNNVWSYDYFGDARTVDTHVKKLRMKLKKYGSYIKTVWGIGYKFDRN